MALLFIDGFDHYNTAEITTKWTNAAAVAISSNGGRRGTGALLTNNDIGSFAYRDLSTSASTVIAGFAFKPTGPFTFGEIFSLWEGGSVQNLRLIYNSSNKIAVYCGATLLGQTTLSIAVGTTRYIEFKATIGASGSFEVRIDGTPDVSASGVNTQNGGTGVVNRIQFGVTGFGGMYGAYFDDFYFCDNSGANNNNFLGDCRIDTVVPTGDGYYTDFTPSSGTAHYPNVNTTPAATVTYNYTSVVGAKDSYTYPAIPILPSSTVFGVQLNAFSEKSDSGSRSFATLTRLGGVDANGASTPLAASYIFLSQIYETDPTTVNWTQTTVNSAQFGVQVTA